MIRRYRVSPYSQAILIDSVSHRARPYGTHTACGVVTAGRTAYGPRVVATSVCADCITASEAVPA